MTNNAISIIIGIIALLLLGAGLIAGIAERRGSGIGVADAGAGARTYSVPAVVLVGFAALGIGIFLIFYNRVDRSVGRAGLTVGRCRVALEVPRQALQGENMVVDLYSTCADILNNTTVLQNGTALTGMLKFKNASDVSNPSLSPSPLESVMLPEKTQPMPSAKSAAMYSRPSVAISDTSHQESDGHVRWYVTEKASLDSFDAVIRLDPKSIGQEIWLVPSDKRDDEIVSTTIATIKNCEVVAQRPKLVVANEIFALDILSSCTDAAGNVQPFIDGSASQATSLGTVQIGNRSGVRWIVSQKGSNQRIDFVSTDENVATLTATTMQRTPITFVGGAGNVKDFLQALLGFLTGVAGIITSLWGFLRYGK